MSYFRGSDRFLPREVRIRSESLVTREITWVAETALPEAATCAICNRAFGRKESQLCRIPVQVGCQHIFGSVCISSWRSEGNNGSCPKCQSQAPPAIHRLSVAALLGPDTSRSASSTNTVETGSRSTSLSESSTGPLPFEQSLATAGSKRKAPTLSVTDRSGLDLLGYSRADGWSVPDNDF